ncbi:hypothetical protein [Nocardioides sp. Soil805]|uniref:hypothetical protein n=1 Tax=Nocardioides sp. Soil805 TaxID=1736416 RepID=UPI0007026003|nr:hypothetical protein [Nocardioides sp. Soil805]KRF37612.1 hypothetical protein ASG94_10020 [Nocardioides sp. Soil805]
MKPLQSVAMGLLVVALTARVHGYDALPDAAGWVLVLLGIRRLALSLALGVLAAAALVVSLVVWWPSVQEALDGLHPSLWWAANVPQLAACTLLCRELGDRARSAGDGRATAWLRTATVLVGASALAPVVAFSTDASDDVLAAVYAAAAGVVLLLIVLLFSYAARPWAGARSAEPVARSVSGS